MGHSRPNGFVAVIPVTHPDATAFAARFLREPADRRGQVVIDAWLDEQGGYANEVWASYLRSMAHAQVGWGGA